LTALVLSTTGATTTSNSRRRPSPHDCTKRMP